MSRISIFIGSIFAISIYASAAYVVMRCLSVRPSVCVSVTFVDVDHVKTNKHIIKIFSPRHSTSCKNVNETFCLVLLLTTTLIVLIFTLHIHVQYTVLFSILLFFCFQLYFFAFY